MDFGEICETRIGKPEEIFAKTDKFPERMRFICDLTGNFKSVEYRRFLQHMQGILSIGKAVEQKTINDVGSVASLGHCTEIDEPPGCCADLLLNWIA